jgi:hypothetical protein
MKELGRKTCATNVTLDPAGAGGLNAVAQAVGVHEAVKPRQATSNSSI